MSKKCPGEERTPASCKACIVLLGIFFTYIALIGATAIILK